jgi:hypothetical protein
VFSCWLPNVVETSSRLASVWHIFGNQFTSYAADIGVAGLFAFLHSRYYLLKIISGDGLEFVVSLDDIIGGNSTGSDV